MSYLLYTAEYASFLEVTTSVHPIILSGFLVFVVALENGKAGVSEDSDIARWLRGTAVLSDSVSVDSCWLDGCDIA